MNNFIRTMAFALAVLGSYNGVVHAASEEELTRLLQSDECKAVLDYIDSQKDAAIALGAQVGEWAVTRVDALKEQATTLGDVVKLKAEAVHDAGSTFIAKYAVKDKASDLCVLLRKQGTAVFEWVTNNPDKTLVGVFLAGTLGLILNHMNNQGDFDAAKQKLSDHRGKLTALAAAVAVGGAIHQGYLKV